MLSVVTRGPHQTQSIADTAGPDWNRRSVISTEPSLSWLEITTFVDEFYDGAGRYLGSAGSVDVIPDGVIVHAPAPARESRHGEACGAPDQGTHGVKVDMRLGVTRHQLLEINDHLYIR